MCTRARAKGSRRFMSNERHANEPRRSKQSLHCARRSPRAFRLLPATVARDLPLLTPRDLNLITTDMVAGVRRLQASKVLLISFFPYPIQDQAVK